MMTSSFICFTINDLFGDCPVKYNEVSKNNSAQENWVSEIGVGLITNLPFLNVK